MISVIIPVYNAEHFIGQQLARFEQQKLAGTWEIIVSDNGSTDSTLDIVKDFQDKISNLRLVDASSRKGPAAARNIGAEHAKGEFLFFADADDYISFNWLASYSAAMESADFCTGPFTLFRDGEEVPDLNGDDNGKPMVHMGWKPAALGCNLAIRRSVFMQLGGFDETFMSAQDIELSWRVQLAGYSLTYVPGARVAKRQRASFRSKYYQHKGFGFADVALLQRFQKYGLKENRNIALRSVAWLILPLPDLLSARKRNGWGGVAGRLIGRLQAGMRLGRQPEILIKEHGRNNS